MTVKVPAQLRKPTILDKDGELKINPGRFARGAVAIAFDMLGGVESFAEWAEENKSEYYTKIFPKIITRETELGVTEGVEALLDQLDQGVLDNAEVIDAEYEELPSSHKSARLQVMAETYANGEPDYDDEDNEN